MKSLTFTVCLTAACLTAATAAGAKSPWTYSTRTIVCSFSELNVGIGTGQGGFFVVSNGAAVLISAWPARGMLRRIDPHCRRIRVRTLPRPIVPRPNYAMTIGASSSCSSRGPVLIHARFLRTAGRRTGLYVSVRERRTGRSIVAGLFTTRGAREYWGPTCVG